MVTERKNAISEGDIASSYGVSRTPVREAILKLSDEKNRAISETDCPVLAAISSGVPWR